jgi:hypothetical protein
VADGVANDRSWAEAAVEDACRLTEQWFRGLRRFEPRVNLGSVVGHKYPALLSEQDGVIHFARFLNEAGVPWEDIHHQVSMSRWMFDEPHPAATTMTEGERRRRIDLALLRGDTFLNATLPATQPGFQFDAFLEFGYLSDYWHEPGARNFGEPLRGQKKVKEDVAKVARNLAGDACRLGYVIVYAECDYGFEERFASESETATDCRVRFIRDYDQYGFYTPASAAPALGRSSVDLAGPSTLDLQAAIQRRNLVATLATARELPQLSLEDRSS